MNVPDFDKLPPVEGMPQGCAWGVFDKDGKKDLVGTLNHLTPAVVKAAAAEVKDGISISLNWPLNAMDHLPVPGRRKLDRQVLPLDMGGKGWDDEVHFNTQKSSQWDSLVHWPHQGSGLSYNGADPTAETLTGASTAANKLPTLDHWHARGGLVGRGVLLDFAAYAEEKGIEYHAFDGYAISTKELEAVATHQGVEFRPGDVLVLRTGTTDMLAAAAPGDLSKMASGKISGVESSVDAARWFWDKRFAAVASDTLSLEVVNYGGPEGMKPLVLHEHLLGLFGMSIGELWDLSRLAAVCREKGRYSFMLTSAPLNVPCSVASPPNALAIL